MPPLNLEHLNGLLPRELTLLFTGLPTVPPGQSGSFEQHLEQARQTVERAPGSDPPPPERRPEANDRRPDQDTPPAPESREDSTGQVSPGNSQEESSEAAQTQANSEEQVDASETATCADQESNAAETDPASDKEEDENDLKKSAVDAAQVVDALQTDASRKPSDPEAVGGDSNRGTGNVGGWEGQPDAEASAEKAPPADPEADGKRLIPLKVEQLADGRVAGESETSSQAEFEPETTTSGVSAASSQAEKGPQTTASGATGAAVSGALGASSQAQAPAVDARRQSARESGDPTAVERPSPNSPAQLAKDTGREPMQQTAPLGPDTLNEAGTETVDTATTASAPTGPNGGETNMVPPVGSNQSARPTSTTSPQGTSGSEPVDRVRFVQRVARAFQAMGDRGGSIRLRLHPPELGSLRLEVTVRDGTMTARLEVENSHARTMLLDNLPALRDRLAEQEIKVGRFDVDLTDQSAGGSPERPGSHPPPHDNPDQGAPDAGLEPDIDVERPSRTRAVTPPGHESQLDILI